jgi:Protein of unknown function (DUF1496)
MKGLPDMIRHFVWMIICVVCAGAAVAAPEQRADASPVCLYNSKSYSDGAYICVQKSLMLTCASDGTHATWKAVLDKDLSERCTAPMTLNYPPERREHSHRRHVFLRRVHPVAEGSAKCFAFNGKQYCE